jgi:Spy/CpxP family protein refolding chaperone
MTVAEVERLFDAWELMQAKTPLQLDDQALLAFMARFQEVQRVQRQHQAARQRLIGELNTLMKAEATVDDAALGAKTKAFDDLETQHLQDLGKAMSAVDQILTVKQRARLRVFMNRMENQKLVFLAQARQQANKGAATAPAPPAPVKIIK